MVWSLGRCSSGSRIRPGAGKPRENNITNSKNSGWGEPESEYSGSSDSSHSSAFQAASGRLEILHLIHPSSSSSPHWFFFMFDKTAGVCRNFCEHLLALTLIANCKNYFNINTHRDNSVKRIASVKDNLKDGIKFTIWTWLNKQICSESHLNMNYKTYFRLSLLKG